MIHHTAILLLGAAVLLLTGCGPIFSETTAPNMLGSWDMTYGDDLQVELNLGGAVYTDTIGLQGGTISITHENEPFEFELDCGSEDVVCPTEAWPALVELRERDARFPHQVTVILPGQECEGETVPADPAECGKETDNPDCDDVCDSELVVTEIERLGVISEAGDRFDTLLGAGVASNGVNCAVLGISAATMALTTTGGPDKNRWDVTEITEGEVTLGYSGACLWADTSGAEPEAIVLGASIKYTTSFMGLPVVEGE